MALKLNRLKMGAMTFRANLDAIGRAYDDNNALAFEHLTDVKSLGKDVKDMSDDLKAAVGITKNSVDSSNNGGGEIDKTVPESLQDQGFKGEKSLSIVEQQAESQKKDN